MKHPPYRQKILDFLREHQGRQYTPKQIARYLRMSERTATKHLEHLVESEGVVEVVREAHNA